MRSSSAPGTWPPSAPPATHYRAARAAWAETAGAARGVYQDDLAFGPEPHLRGHWADRLAAIDADLAAMTARLDCRPA